MKFIRKNGRIIPIKDGKNTKLKSNERTITHNNSEGKSIKVTLRKENTTALERFKSGAKFGAKLGGLLGSIEGAGRLLSQSSSSNPKELLLRAGVGATAGGVVGAVSGSLSIGALTSLLGRRQVEKVKSIDIKGFKKKKSSSV